MTAYLSLQRTWFVLMLILLWSHRHQPALVAKKATTTIPIVITNLGTPWEQVWSPVWRGREAMSRGFRV